MERVKYHLKDILAEIAPDPALVLSYQARRKDDVMYVTADAVIHNGFDPVRAMQICEESAIASKMNEALNGVPSTRRLIQLPLTGENRERALAMMEREFNWLKEGLAPCRAAFGDLVTYGPADVPVWLDIRGIGKHAAQAVQKAVQLAMQQIAAEEQIVANAAFSRTSYLMRTSSGTGFRWKNPSANWVRSAT